jgi:hypothetical protein
MRLFRILLLSFLTLFNHLLFGQDTTSVSDEEVAPKPRKEKGFQVGFFAGTYFASKHTSSLYDGYGLDVNGNKNDFVHSAMYQQIIVYNGGFNGQPDRIAQALNVQHGEWFFTENDMPVNLKYGIAFMAGGGLRYAFNRKSSLLLNANTAKLSVNGNFTIVTQTLNSSGNQQPAEIRTFPIVGTEQRVLLQLGYQHILGENDKMNFFLEGGVNVTMAKMIRNQANINGLVMDLMSIYYYASYTGFRSKYLTGVGTGAFAGAGANISVGSKWIIQFLYVPSYEYVKLGSAPRYSLNHAFGVRGYYTF